MSEHRCDPFTAHDIRYPETDPRHHPPLCPWHLTRGGEVKVQRSTEADRRDFIVSPSGENAVEIQRTDYSYPFEGELYLTTIDSDDYAAPGDFATGSRGKDVPNVDVPVEHADVATSLIRDSVVIETHRTHDGVALREIVTDEGRHHILIDFDVEAHLIPSTTPGHSHLYVRANTEWENISKLLDALVACGVVEEGYASASKHRRRTRLRLPWVKKEGRTPA